MPDEAHVILIRAKLTEKYGSLWLAAHTMSFGAMSGAQLLTALRSLPMHPGVARSINEAVGIDPNSFADQARSGQVTSAPFVPRHLSPLTKEMA